MESFRTVLDAQLFPSNMSDTLGNYLYPHFSVFLFSNCGDGVPIALRQTVHSPQISFSQEIKQDNKRISSHVLIKIYAADVWFYEFWSMKDADAHIHTLEYCKYHCCS